MSHQQFVGHLVFRQEGSYPETLVLYRMRPTVSVRVGFGDGGARPIQLSAAEEFPKAPLLPNHVFYRQLKAIHLHGLHCP